MTVKLRKQRLLNDALRSMNSAFQVIREVPKVPVVDDLQAIRNAANQARQAAQELDVLSGILELEQDVSNKK